MDEQDAFQRIMASLYGAMLDDAGWPATSALIDEACGVTGNTIMVGEGPKDDLRALFVGAYCRGSAAKTRSGTTSRTTIRPTNAYRVSGNSLTAVWCTWRTSTRRKS